MTVQTFTICGVLFLRSSFISTRRRLNSLLNYWNVSRRIVKLPLKVVLLLGCSCAMAILVYVPFFTNDLFDVSELVLRSSSFSGGNKCWLSCFNFDAKVPDGLRHFRWRRCAIKAANKLTMLFDGTMESSDSLFLWVDIDWSCCCVKRGLAWWFHRNDILFICCQRNCRSIH